MSYLTSIQMNPLSRSLPMALAVGALALMSARVHAADPDSLNPVQLDPITVSAPAENIVGREEVGTPTEEGTSTARVVGQLAGDRDDAVPAKELNLSAASSRT